MMTAASPQAATGTDPMEGVRFDDERFPDAMGWRAKFGVLTPAPNTIVENEFHEMAPLGVVRTSRGNCHGVDAGACRHAMEAPVGGHERLLPARPFTQHSLGTTGPRAPICH